MTTTLPRLRESLSLVKEATGPDREIDRRLALALGWKTFETARKDEFGVIWKCPATGFERFGGPWDWTASLDAVVSLIEREMPGKARRLLEAALTDLDWGGRNFEGRWPGLPFAQRLVLSLLAVFLSALIAQMQREEEAA